MFVQSIILCLVTIIRFNYCLEGLPEYIHVCPKNANSVQCITDNVERLRPYIKNGIPELDAPSIEPLYLGDLLVSESTNNNACTGNVRVILGKHSSNDEKVKVSKLDIKIKLGKGNLHLRNLFNGDKILGEAINGAINQNFELFSSDIVPLVEKALQRTFKKMANKMASRYTYSELFPIT